MGKPIIPRSRRHPLGPQVRINVTAELINTAARSHSSHCMIAEAIKTVVPSAKKVSVDISTCRFSDFEKGLRYVYLTPRTAQEALVDFDEGLTPKPFSFLLRGAHVTRAGSSQAKAESSNKAESKRPSRGAKLPNRKRLVSGHGTNVGAVPRAVGGRRPPQLHIRREFGLRAFRAASLNRLVKEQEAELVSAQGAASTAE